MNFVVLAIIIATVIFSSKGFTNYAFFNQYKFSVAGIRRGEWTRYVSAGFLHADWLHLFLNMYVLHSFSSVVINALGTSFFIAVYFGALLAGNYISYLIYRNDLHYNAVGASGAVTGVLYAAIVLHPDMTLGVFFFFPMPAIVFGLLYLSYSIYAFRKNNDNIGHSAHIGGAIAGLFFVLAENPSLFIVRPFIAFLLLLPVGVFLYMVRDKLR